MMIYGKLKSKQPAKKAFASYAESELKLFSAQRAYELSQGELPNLSHEKWLDTITAFANWVDIVRYTEGITAHPAKVIVRAMRNIR